MINMATPERVREIVSLAGEGAASVGRDPTDLQVVPKIRVALHEDPALARRALKKVLAFYSLQEGYGQLLEAMGFPGEVKAAREAHRSGGFRAAWDQVPDYMLDGVPMFAGSNVDGLGERLREFEAAGATRLVVAFVPASDELEREVERFIEMADFVAAPV